MTKDNIIDLDAPYGRKKDGTPMKKRGGSASGGWSGRGVEFKPPGGQVWGPGKPRSDVPVGPKPGNMMTGAMTVEKRALADGNKLMREQAAEEAMQTIYGVMHGSDHDMTKVTAAKIMLERIEGLSVQRVITNEVRTVEEIRSTDPVEASKEYRRIIGGE